MKRSEINKALKRMEGVINDLKISLPPFCNFTPEEWLTKGHDYDEVRDNMLDTGYRETTDRANL